MGSINATHGVRLRVDLFSDAVFAVAITLLVLNLPLTAASGSLAHAFADRWAAFAAFGISFALIGCLWVSHFRLFLLVHEVSSQLLFLNLAVLLSVVLIPFGTSTMATFVTHSDTQSHVAAAVFAGVLAFMGVTFGALHLYVTSRARRVGADASLSTGFVTKLRRMAGLIVNLIGVGVAFVSPLAVLAMTGAVAVYYLVDDLTGAIGGMPQVSATQPSPPEMSVIAGR